MQGEAVDPHPHMGQVARIQAALGHAGVKLREPADKRLRVLARAFQEQRDILQVVLAVGIYLQRMAEAQACGFTQTCHDRTTLALVDVQLDQEDVLPSCQGFEDSGAGRAAGVVDQHAGQVGLEQFGDHFGHGQFVVVDGDYRAGVMCRHKAPCRPQNGRLKYQSPATPNRIRPLEHATPSLR
ncbi:hypothetical protein D3C76_1214450 [compost metagenome]